MISEGPRSLQIDVLRVTQPIGDFYVGSIKAKDLFNIAYFDIRRIFTEDGIDSYLGIQRQISTKRINEIAAYSRSGDATFPTAVILAVREDTVTLESLPDCGDRFFRLTLRNITKEDGSEDVVLYKQIARVIDGQHRIASLEGYEGPEFELNVSIFVGADISDQANIFSTVNLHQTKVNKSLVYDLFALSRTRSPERTCHNAVVALDKTEGSPFFQKIKRLGHSTDGRYGETLSQATVVEGILQYISGDKVQIINDREVGRRGGKWPKVSATEASKLVLRPFFVEDRDAQIANLIWEYFAAVKARWPRAWDSQGRGAILNKTNGYNALMRFFRPAYLYYASPGNMVRTPEFLKLLEKVELDDSDFNPDRYLPGTSGATKLYNDLVEHSRVLAVD
jgi:DGQHR domain-containing protein